LHRIALEELFEGEVRGWSRGNRRGVGQKGTSPTGRNLADRGKPGK
jgi:hypothetical protein